MIFHEKYIFSAFIFHEYKQTRDIATLYFYNKLEILFVEELK